MLKKIAVILGGLWIIIFTAWLALSIVLYLKSDELGKYLILQINKIQSGEITVGNVRVSPIFQFPHFSIILNDVSYFEHKSDKRTADETPIVRIDNFFCGVQLTKLLKSEVNILAIKVNGGELDLVIYSDGSLNLIDAVEKDSTSQVSKESVNKNKRTETSEFSLVVNELAIENLKVNVENQLEKKRASILIKYFDSDFLYAEDKANLNFTTSIFIDQLKIAEDKFITNQEINLKIASQLDKRKGLQVNKGKIEIENTSFLFNGSFNPADDGELFLNIESDGSLNILSWFINEDVAKNLEQGDFILKGFIGGKVFTEFPIVEMDFGFKNVELVNPITKRQIKNLNLKGFFNSGRNKDLSAAKLTIDTLFTEFPAGHLKLSGSITDFLKPKFDINLFLDADLTGLEDLIDLGGLDSIKGRLNIVERFKGDYNIDGEKLNSEIDSSEINFYDFGFIIPNTIRFDKINGYISKIGDEFIIKDLNIKSQSTDFIINGEVKNILYLIFDIEKEITADLSIKSEVFDLPSFLAFDPSIKRDFPHRILDLDLVVNASTTTSKALNFKSFPESSYDIHRLYATVEDFLPRINIESGYFKISEGLLGFHMDFDDFKTEFLNGKFNFSAQYNSSAHQPFYIKSDIWMSAIELSKLFYNEKTDTIPSFFDSKLFGSLFLELQFAEDTSEFKLFNIKNGDISYYFGEDTIETKSLMFNFKDIDYDLVKNDNPLATLYSKGKINSKMIKTNHFIVEDFSLDFSSQKGEYEIESKSVKLFGESSIGKGKYFLKPFTETPSYRIQYNVSRFSINEMLNTFLEDTLLRGNMSLSMDITMKGDEWNEMIRSMDGHINLSGKNLTMYGINADKVIKEFQRSQNFNLVDAGAVLLAGPVGLAVTKGSDFARLLIINSGESSHITQLTSNWKADDGLLTLGDVAFATNKNRVAAKGWINLVTDSLDISFAILNKTGCSIFTQDLFGDLNKPKMGEVKVMRTLLAPVTNLYNDIVGNDCTVFYNGTVKQPVNK